MTCHRRVNSLRRTPKGLDNHQHAEANPSSRGMCTYEDSAGYSDAEGGKISGPIVPGHEKICRLVRASNVDSCHWTGCSPNALFWQSDI